MTVQLEKVYNPAKIEDKWYQHWLDNNYFHAEVNPDKTPYTIVIPPPNVTGMLTMGHVLNNTIQDILIRKARMEGKEACWIPGTDHASIATEGKVVKMLKEQGIDKSTLTRAEFLEHAWKWKEEYGGIIIQQLKKLGCSCDWERERFTMDAGYSRAVLAAFVKLYEKGLIYRGYRLVNWCPVSKSAISDEEVIHQEVNGHLWYFKYPIKDSDEFMVVATTRPETMLGDTAVAVHPKDERFAHLVGKTIILPLVGRELLVIADDYVDPEFGTGCVKVTPAHDPNDFAMGERHNLEFINVMNDDASLNENAPEAYQNLSREDARKAVVKDLDSQGFLEKTEEYVNKVGYSERGNVPIEFYMSEQWFMKMNELSKPALQAVKDGKIKFHPEHWTKTYDHWMDNIKDWCISRQLWWGHQIPVWYHNDDPEKLHVSVDGPEDPENWTQDPDVLDTWASSWLWPIAVHDWPDESEELNYFYPTDALVTGPDIIFFWVARMIITGYEFMGDLPFKDVYFTSILRDETGRKFSKSLGNSPDPFDLFEEYGTDAVRFGIMLMATQGLDVLFSSTRLEVGRNFMNKLWNASRFVMMNLEDGNIPDIDIENEELDLPELWIMSRLQTAINDYNRQLVRFHFNEAAKVLYDFTWSDFCDWYIEIAKTRFNGSDEHRADVSRAVAVHVLRTIYKILHPYAPFITEELWAHVKEKADPDIIISPWPETDESFLNKRTEQDMSLLQEIVSGIRTVRSRMNVPPAKKSELVAKCDTKMASFLQQYEKIIATLSRTTSVTAGSSQAKPEQSATVVIGDNELYIPLGGLIDLEEEKARLQKRANEINGHLAGISKKLSNEQFISRAPEEVVAREKEKQNDMSAELEKVNTNLEMLQ
ncbi:MAG TPA: valine--tRNA ligase [Candidatus Marinimicrobia bacterium]|jgi:valyl-tRNA synthetase|nr:valine--tRNA ligase [Candidatus Neomarinimicrobiota bacterium]MDP6276094.1 valine--tRNA ligase [Candidatus Neomarinimicrobiota bacterium]MDP7217433.1 valine--tRNA ligase [Candidatus Neomarinimicrobiota bacterium]MDP7436606.1 valine--tRNA ligase [Candidatus Neomarinimicrobiota bacterium]HBN45302.1 valine--tRNA ligase [Candidatus Neomarinimicrobiota bacterium]|tara:strand:+ start:7577 stop:10210 length:2634 start_codon:yes stop_codon:yes gene_type:complete